MEINITNFELSDLEKIKDTLESDFDDFWNYSIFKQELSNENSYYYVAKNSDNEIVGFAGFMVILDEADITNIVVKKDYRNNKIATLLLEKLLNDLNGIEKIETVTLEVNENNIYAIKLYENFGFKNLGVRKNYYKNHENAIIMTKIISPKIDINVL